MIYEKVIQGDKLAEQELMAALRKQINAYQIQALHRFTSGQDHWEWFVGPGAGRLDFLQKQLEILASKISIPSGIIPKLMSRTARGKPVEAFVIDGRWVAMCECGGQEVVDIADPVFVCLSVHCFNIANNHWPRPVKFPADKDMRQAAEILLARPNPINRCWDLAGKIFNQRESIARIRKENTVYGIPEFTKVKRRERDGIRNSIN